MPIRRIALIAALLLFPAALVLVAMQGFIVRNAVVTAELFQLRAPIDGTVTAVPVQRGRYFADGGLAVSLADPRADRRDHDELALELARTRSAIAARRADLAAVDALLAELDARLPETLASIRADLSLQQEIALADRAGVEARIAFLTKQSERARRLQGSAASQASLEQAEAELAAAQAELQALDLTIERLAQQQGYLDRGQLVTELTDDAIALLDSRRTLTQRRQAGLLELAALEATLALQDAKLAIERSFLDVRARADLTLPADSAVWEVLVAPGANIVAGLPLLSYVSCAGRFVEAAIDDSTVELLRSDHGVEVTLYGSDEALRGRVLAVYGSAGRVTEHASLAAHLGEVGPSDAVVLIEIDDPAGEAREHRLCDVGRTAYVAFDDIGLLDPLLNRIF